MNKEEENYDDDVDHNDNGDVVEDETSKIILEKTKAKKWLKSMKNVFTSQTLFNFSACWPATRRSGIKTKRNKQNKKYSVLFYFNKFPIVFI